MHRHKWSILTITVKDIIFGSFTLFQFTALYILDLWLYVLQLIPIPFKVAILSQPGLSDHLTVKSTCVFPVNE